MFGSAGRGDAGLARGYLASCRSPVRTRLLPTGGRTEPLPYTTPVL